MNSGVNLAEPQLAHMVFFTLAKDDEGNRDALIAACQKYLSNHDGTVYFSAGAIADDLTREVNDREFDVALHLVFANKAAHDTYQTHPQHLEFIEKSKHPWSGVRVFDSHIPAPTRDALPPAAKGFSGMFRGEVVGKHDGALLSPCKRSPTSGGRAKQKIPSHGEAPTDWGQVILMESARI